MPMFGKVFSREKEKWVLVGLIILIIITALNVIVSRVHPTTVTPTRKPTQSAVLSLATQKTSVSKGDTFTVQILLAPNGNAVDAVDAVLTYDANQLEATQVKAGTLFTTYPLQSTSAGQVKLSGFSMPDRNGKVNAASQKGIMGTVTFRAKRTGVAKINFDASQIVVASKGQNVLKSSPGLSVDIR